MNKRQNILRVYLAAPLFNNIEREFNLMLSNLIEPIAEVFLPQRDGKLFKNLIRSGVSMETARQVIFDADIAAIERCDCVVAVLDGRVVDEGVAFELGYARAAGKKCFGIKTDDRSLFLYGDNPMIVSGCHEILSSIDDVVGLLKLEKYSSKENLNYRIGS